MRVPGFPQIDGTPSLSGRILCSEPSLSPCPSWPLIGAASIRQAAPTIRVHADAPGHAINPAIYGINSLANGKDAYLAADSAMLGSDRMGGNRMTGYNWENNYSNAGSDYQHNSDNWLTQNPLPTPAGSGGSVGNFVERNLGLGRKPIVQLQMAGYVAADGGGQRDRQTRRRHRAAGRKWSSPREPLLR